MLFPKETDFVLADILCLLLAFPAQNEVSGEMFSWERRKSAPLEGLFISSFRAVFCDNAPLPAVLYGSCAALSTSRRLFSGMTVLEGLPPVGSGDDSEHLLV